MDKFLNLGMPSDRKQRISRARSDDHLRRTRIDTARSAIFKGVAVDSDTLKDVLDKDTSVPTAVRRMLRCMVRSR